MWIGIFVGFIIFCSGLIVTNVAKTPPSANLGILLLIIGVITLGATLAIHFISIL
jgi:hypothetical protein